MSLALVALVGVLCGTGVYSMLHRSLTRIVLGVGLLGNGVNLLLIVAGSRPGAVPLVGELEGATDAVPQALVLTAIVIGFAMTALLLVVTLASRGMTGTDHVDGSEES
jgi:multisubunit Na+/H+ antiporter MnhC subunit